MLKIVLCFDGGEVVGVKYHRGVMVSAGKIEMISELGLF